MSAIGSDPNYRPGGSGSGGINTAEVTAQLQEASKNALSFLSSTVSVLSDQVSKVTVSNTQNGTRSTTSGGGGGNEVSKIKIAS